MILADKRFLVLSGIAYEGSGFCDWIGAYPSEDMARAAARASLSGQTLNVWSQVFDLAEEKIVAKFYLHEAKGEPSQIREEEHHQ